MKAKDYARKYIPEIKENVQSQEKLIEITSKILNELQEDLSRTLEARKIRSNESAARAVLEINNKWNAISRIIADELGGSPLKKDGFRNMKVLQVPELKEIFRKFGIAGYDK